ncbi:hypothetical protein BDW75DRAFT_44597 [Aspergillus navahoensis]
MAGTSKESLVQPSYHRSQASTNHDNEEDPQTGNFTKKHPLLVKESEAEGKDRSQKRRRRKPQSKKIARNTSVSARHAEGCIGAFQAPSGVGFLTGPDQAQEIFGRGVIRIQPHGPRYAYFLTFLPDVDRLLSRSTPGSNSDQKSCTEHATNASSKASVLERNVRLARRRTHLKAGTKHGTRQENSRRGML